MTSINSGELARRLAVSRETLRNYTSQFSDFLTEDAVGVAVNAKRRYSTRDQLVLATIAAQRARGLPIEDIKGLLKDGKLVAALPEAPTPEEEDARRHVALMPVSQYERALDRITVLTDDLQAARQERDRAISTWQTDTTELNARISKLERELGALEGELVALKSERRPASWWIVAVALVALLVAAGTVYVVVLALSVKPS